MGAPMCPSCSKFCSLEQDDDVDMGEVQIDSDSGEVTGNIRLVLKSQCCGEEIREANVEISDCQWEHTCEEGKISKDWNEGDEQFEIEDSSGEVSDRYTEGPIRYAKHYWGADLTIEVKCNKCGESHTLETRVEEQGSCFEDLN